MAVYLLLSSLLLLACFLSLLLLLLLLACTDDDDDSVEDWKPTAVSTLTNTVHCVRQFIASLLSFSVALFFISTSLQAATTTPIHYFWF
jgi:hypothetical protein